MQFPVSEREVGRERRAVRVDSSEGTCVFTSPCRAGYRYDQEGLQIGFSAEYLLEFLGAVGTASIRMQVKDTASSSVPPEMTPSTTDTC